MSDLEAEMAVVVDEYGGTEGIVSFASIIDNLFNEFLPEQERFIDQIDDNVYRISGVTESDEVAEVLGVELVASARTIAGLVIDKLGELPRHGSEVEVAGYLFRVMEIDKRRIITLRAERIDA